MTHKQDEITVKQIDCMKHALGYDKSKVKRKAYKAYRNYFTTSNPSDIWQKLIDLGLAEGKPFENGIGDEPMIYFVTDEGLAFLGDLLGIKITETN